MNSRPAEYGRHQPLFTVDEDPLRRGDLVIHPSVALEIDNAFGGNIVDEPADLIGMRFNDDFERRFWIDDADGRSVRIDEMGVHIRFQVIQPELLTAALKTYRRRIVNIILQEGHRMGR